MTEESLIALAQQGSEESFCQLVRLHQDSVRAYLFRYVRDRALTDDLAQETFLAAFRRLDTFKGESSLRAWLLGIARLGALKFLRDRQARLSLQTAALEDAVAEWRAQEIEGSAAADPAQELAALRECLHSLSPAGADAVDQFYFRGRPLTQVAQKLGKREGAMKMTLLRIREALRECVEKRMSASEVSV